MQPMCSKGCNWVVAWKECIFDVKSYLLTDLEVLSISVLRPLNLAWIFAIHGSKPLQKSSAIDTHYFNISKMCKRVNYHTEDFEQQKRTWDMVDLHLHEYSPKKMWRNTHALDISSSSSYFKKERLKCRKKTIHHLISRCEMAREHNRDIFVPRNWNH